MVQVALAAACVALSVYFAFGVADSYVTPFFLVTLSACLLEPLCA